MKFKPIALLVTSAATAAGSIAQQGVSKNEITVGTIQDMSGPLAAYGKQAKLDLIQYLLFPNLSPWCGQATPLVDRFRPHGDNPEESIMEIKLLFAKGVDGSHPPPAPCTTIGIEDSWHKIPGIGTAADVTNQDTDNLKRIQRGVRASKKPGVTLSNYQESRIRHCHRTLDGYMAR